MDRRRVFLATVLPMLVAGSPCRMSSSPGGERLPFVPVPSSVSPEITFQSVCQAAPLGQGPEKATVHVAWGRDGLSAFLPFLREDHQRSVQAVDYASDVALAVFAGRVGSSGYSITVRQIEIEGLEVRVIVAIHRPAPSEYVRPGFTNPYHVVKVAKVAFGDAAPCCWVLVDDEGHTLATGRR